MSSDKLILPVPENYKTDLTGFTRYVRECVDRRHWSIAETARRASLAQPELSRVMNERRAPTLRIIHGLTHAFFTHPSNDPNVGEPASLAGWWQRLGELAVSSRRILRDRRLGNP